MGSAQQMDGARQQASFVESHAAQFLSAQAFRTSRRPVRLRLTADDASRTARSPHCRARLGKDPAVTLQVLGLISTVVVLADRFADRRTSSVCAGGISVQVIGK